MKIDKKILTGFTCAIGAHAAFFSVDLPKTPSNLKNDIVFEQSVSSVEISFASYQKPKKEIKKEVEQKKVVPKKVKKFKILKTEKEAPLKEQIQVKKIKDKKKPVLEKTVLKEKAGVVNKIIKPVKIYNKAPVYPLFAVRMGFEGKVLLNLFIDEKGIVKNISIKKSSGHKLLDDAAIEAAYKWRFKPASKDSKSISYSKEVPVVFRLKDI